MSAAHISGIVCPKKFFFALQKSYRVTGLKSSLKAAKNYTYCLDYPINLKIYLPKVTLYAVVLVD